MDAPGLESLLAELRARGVPIGELQYRRLRRVFSSELPPDPARLRLVLRAALIWRPADVGVFENAFRAWWLASDAWVQQVADATRAESGASGAAPPRFALGGRVQAGTEGDDARSLGVAGAARDGDSRSAAGGSAPDRGPWWGMVRGALVAVALFVATYWVVWLLLELPTRGPGTGAGTGTGTGTGAGGDVDPPAPKPGPDGVLATVQVHRLVSVSTVPRTQSPARWAWLVLALLGIAAGTTSLRSFRRRAARLEPRPVTRRRVDRRFRRTPPPAAQRFELLDRAARTEMVFGVERFVGDEFLDVLDLPQTVAATARAGGLPELRYQRPLFERTVWLWLDTSLQAEAARRLVGETATQLRAAGLAVREAEFWRSPDLLVERSGRRLRPIELEGQRDAAVVAIVTDGQGIVSRLDDGRFGDAMRDTLRGLAAWPRLALVDAAEVGGPLAAAVEDFGLRVIRPAGLAEFVGAGRRSAPARDEPQPAAVRPRALHGDLRQWARALALGGVGFRAEDAWALHRALGLRCPRLDLDALVRFAEPRAQGWEFPGALQARLLDELARTVPSDLVAVAPRGASRHATAAAGDAAAGDAAAVPLPIGSGLQCALAYWRGRLGDGRDGGGAAGGRGDGKRRDGDESRATRFQRAALDLWDRPQRATATLERLAGTGHAGSVDALLRRFAARTDRQREHDTFKVACLPWRRDQQPEAFQRLSELGLARDLIEFRPPPLPPWLRCLLAACAAVALLGLWRTVAGSPVDRQARVFRVQKPGAGLRRGPSRGGCGAVVVSPSGGHGAADRRGRGSFWSGGRRPWRIRSAMGGRRCSAPGGGRWAPGLTPKAGDRSCWSRSASSGRGRGSDSRSSCSTAAPWTKRCSRINPRRWWHGWTPRGRRSCWSSRAMASSRPPRGRGVPRRGRSRWCGPARRSRWPD